MLSPENTTIIIIGIFVLYAVIIPILDKVKWFKDFISLRWLTVLLYLTAMIAVILDFNHLQTETRNIVIIGSIILSAIFVLVRSLEKINFQRLDHIKTELEYKDLKTKIEIKNKESNENNNTTNNNSDDINTTKND